jgi:hypothetical protein
LLSKAKLSCSADRRRDMGVQITVTESSNFSVCFCYLPAFSLVDEYICFGEISASTFRVTNGMGQPPDLHRCDSVKLINMMMVLLGIWLHLHKCCIGQGRNRDISFHCIASQLADRAARYARDIS